MRAEKTGFVRCAAGLVVGLVCTSAASAVELEQFAYGWPLNFEGEAGLVDVPLTLDVYRGARRLEELAVVDADGNTMPFYRLEASAPDPAEQGTALDVSAVYESPDTQGTDIRIETEDERGRIAVTRPRGDERQRVVAFLADARAVEMPVSAVELDWQALERPFLMRVQIEHSVDLTRWRTVGRGAIAELVIDGERRRHARVPIAASEAGYYRVRWDERVPDWRLEALTLVGSEAAAGPDALTTRPAPSAPPDGTASDSVLYFDAGAELPVTQLRLVFREAYGWANARVAAASALEGPWRGVVGPRLYYRVELDGESLASAPVEIARTEGRYWRVVVDADARPSGVELELGVPPDRLRFAARGRRPYMLAGGTLLEAAGPDPTFARVVAEIDSAARAPRDAVLGERVELGGPAALEAPLELPWQQIALWAVLGLGGLVVLGMAWRLTRELRD